MGCIVQCEGDFLVTNHKYVIECTFLTSKRIYQEISPSHFLSLQLLIRMRFSSLPFTQFY